MSRGFSLVQVCVVLAIVAVLCAVTYPAYHSARVEAAIAKSSTQMHEIAVALALYRSDESEDGQWHGFPPVSGYYQAMDLADLGYPGGDIAMDSSGMGGYFILLASKPEDAQPPDPWWATWSEHGDSSIFLVDPTHRNASKTLFSAFFTHFVLGASLDGTVRRKWGRGDFTHAPFWYGGGR